MKSGLMQAWVAGVLLASAGVVMAEAEAAVAAPKPAAAHAPKAMAERTNWRGVVSAPATNAPVEVVAVLSMKRGPKTSLNLTAADATVAAKLKELAGKQAVVHVKGAMNKDETTIAVSDCKVVRIKAAHAKAADAPAPAAAVLAPQK